MRIHLFVITLVLLVVGTRSHNCGQTPVRPNLDSKGTAVPFSWPWQVALYGDLGEGTTLVCGGSIVASRWILTAAHCVEMARPTFIRAGVFDRTVLNMAEQRIDILNYYVHASYDHLENFPHDIALLELEEDLVYTATVQPICLTRKDSKARRIGSALWKTGWGKLTEKDVYPEKQLHQKNPVVDFNCYDGIRRDRKTFICAGNRTDGACNSDSGGPLVQRTAEGTWYVYGIASHILGEQCGAAAYTRVSTYCLWIEIATRGAAICDRSSTSTHTHSTTGNETEAKKESILEETTMALRCLTSGDCKALGTEYPKLYSILQLLYFCFILIASIAKLVFCGAFFLKCFRTIRKMFST